MLKIVPPATLATFAFAALLGLSPAARADENWEDAKAAFEICYENFPNTRAIHDGLKAAGWRYEGNEGGFKVFTRNGFRAIAATQASAQEASLCFVSSSRLPGQTAVAFAKEVIGRLDGATPADPATHSALIAYDGTLRGIDLRVGAVENLNFGEMRGAAVILGDF